MTQEDVQLVIGSQPTPYVVCPLGLVRCSDDTLLALAIDLEQLVSWETLHVAAVPAGEVDLTCGDGEEQGVEVDGVWLHDYLESLRQPIVAVLRGDYADVVVASAGTTSHGRLLAMALTSEVERLALRCLDHRVPAPGEATSVFDEQSPMHAACQWGQANVVRRLVAAGHSVTSVDRYGNSPLHVAAVAGRARVVEFLLECGADALARNAAGRTPLGYARSMCGGGRLAAIEAILWPLEWPAAARRRTYQADRAARD